VQVGLPYQLHVEVYDSHSNRVHPSDNLVIELEVEEPSYLDLTESLSNGTLHTATPRQPGQAGLEKTRIFFLNQPSVFFGFFLFICPEERVFRVFSVSRILLGASRL
jgi:hypothetical protein